MPINGNSIFLPAAGYIRDGRKNEHVSLKYNTATRQSAHYMAEFLWGNSGGFDVGHNDAYWYGDRHCQNGCPIRPVQ